METKEEFIICGKSIKGHIYSAFFCIGNSVVYPDGTVAYRSHS